LSTNITKEKKVSYSGIFLLIRKRQDRATGHLWLKERIDGVWVGRHRRNRRGPLINSLSDFKKREKKP